MKKPDKMSNTLAEAFRDEVKTRPEYYSQGGIECRDVIQAWGLGFNLGNALKYICRCEKKGNKAGDLQKAMKYLEFEIEEELKNVGSGVFRDCWICSSDQRDSK